MIFFPNDGASEFFVQGTDALILFLICEKYMILHVFVSVIALRILGFLFIGTSIPCVWTTWSRSLTCFPYAFSLSGWGPSSFGGRGLHKASKYTPG